MSQSTADDSLPQPCQVTAFSNGPKRRNSALDLDEQTLGEPGSSCAAELGKVMLLEGQAPKKPANGGESAGGSENH